MTWPLICKERTLDAKEMKTRLRKLADSIPMDIDTSNWTSHMEMHLVEMERLAGAHVERQEYRAARALRDKEALKDREREKHFRETAERIAESMAATGGDQMLASRLVYQQMEDGMSRFDQEQFSASYANMTGQSEPDSEPVEDPNEEVLYDNPPPVPPVRQKAKAKAPSQA